MAHFPDGLEFTPLKAGAVRQRGQHGRQIPVCATLSEQVREGGVGVIEEQIGRYACMKCVVCTLVCNHTGSSVTSLLSRYPVTDLGNLLGFRSWKVCG